MPAGMPSARPRAAMRGTLTLLAAASLGLVPAVRSARAVDAPTPQSAAALGPVTNAAGGTLTVDAATNGNSPYAVTGTSDNTWASVIVGNTGTGVINQTSATAYTFTVSSTLTLGSASTGNGTYNLASGTLAAGSVVGGSGTSTFNFNGGILQAGASTTTFLQGLTTANVQAGGAVIDTQGYNVTVSQKLVHDTTSGAPATDGGLTKNGTGTLTLTNAETYTGPTVVNAGVLAFTGNNNAGGMVAQSSSVTINNGGTVSITGDNNYLYYTATKLTTINAGGLLTIAAGNTAHLGPLTLAGGTLAGPSTLSGNATKFGTYDLDHGVIAGGTSATSTISALSVVPSQASGTIFNVTAGSASGIDLNVTGTLVDSSSITSTGVTKTGGGVMVLSGANTYNSPTTVSGGTLLVNGTSSGTGAFTVQNSGSVLGGTGTISAAVNVTTGTLNPGNSTGANGSAANAGKLTVGALTLSSTATSVFDLNSGTTYDQLVANGNIALGGSTLTLNVTPSTTVYTTGQVLDLFHNNSGVLSGTFSNFANNGLYTYGGDSFLANYTSTDFTLTVTAVPEPATWLGGALLLGATGWNLRRRLPGIRRPC